MGKGWVIVLVAVLLLAVTVAPTAVFAADNGANDKYEAGKSGNAFLYLYEKDADYEFVWDGAWGKLKYTQAAPTFDFVFNGHGLTVGEEYTLIYFPDYEGNPWPREGIVCLASGKANDGGNIHLRSSVDLGSNLPMAGDINEGAKIWLVLSADIDCENCTMSGWNNTEYLFEHHLITYTDTDAQ